MARGTSKQAYPLELPRIFDVFFVSFNNGLTIHDVGGSMRIPVSLRSGSNRTLDARLFFFFSPLLN